MYLTTEDIKGLSGENGVKALKDFLDLKVPENYHLDYKVQHSGSNNREKKKEFLKDVTGFANANGGNLLIGCEEPDENKSTDSILIGIENGDSIARDLERLANSSIDPRISGLRIIPINLQNGNSAIVVHIPPSLSKPHMISHEGHRSFYIRHTESTDPMSTHEIREAVFASASAEARAKDYVEKMEDDYLKYESKERPFFLLQAMPIIPIDSQFDIFSDEIRSALQGHNRQQIDTPNLWCGRRPRPTIDGIRTEEMDDCEDRFILEAHKNGYTSAYYDLMPRPNPNRETEDLIYISIWIKNLFKSYCDFCHDFFTAAQIESPYLMRCQLFKANQVEFAYQPRGGYTKRSKFNKEKMIWPIQIKQIGEGLDKIAQTWTSQLFNAYGYQMD